MENVKTVNFVSENGEQEELTVEQFNEQYVKMEDFQKVAANYQTVVKAFNKLMDEYNQLHVKLLLKDDEEQK